MRLLRVLLAVMSVVIFTACEPTNDAPKNYPTLESIDGTLWYSYDAQNNIFYDIYYELGSGHMDGFDSSERTNKISEREFEYSFTPATANLDAIVELTFDDGQRYGGILIPKGNIQINNYDVYIIQLYELTDDGMEIAKDENGNIKSTLQMWRE